MKIKRKTSWNEVVQDYKRLQKQCETFKNASLVRLSQLRQAIGLLKEVRPHVNIDDASIDLCDRLDEFLNLNGHWEDMDV